MVVPDPLVSICVPTYRRAGHLRQTIESVLAQTFADFEIIVADDCSPDETQALMVGITDPRVRYLRNEVNLGVPRNYNYAESMARGRFLVLLGDHDVMEPTYLQEMLNVAEANPRVGLVASGLVVVDDLNVVRARYVNSFGPVMAGRTLLRRLLTRTTCPFPVTTLIRRSAAEEIKPLFDPQHWWYADQGLWLRLSARADFGYVAKPLLRFRTREAEHHLHGRDWESALCLDRIHREHWPLLHPHPTWQSGLDWVLYDLAKLRRAVMWRGGRKLRGEPWGPDDQRSTLLYLSGPSRIVLSLVGLIPPWLAAGFQKAWRWHMLTHRQQRVA